MAEFAANGDDGAFAEVVRRYAGMVFAICLGVTRDAHDAEDAAQAAFLALATHCKSGKTVVAVGPWLQQVAKRTALNVRRSRKRREAREQRHGELARSNGHPPEVAPSPHANGRKTEVDTEQLNRLLMEELARLPAKYQLPLVSLYFGGMSREQIAEQMGLKLGTLGVRLQRGRQMLARRLAERGRLPEGFVLNCALAPAVLSTVAAGLSMRVADAVARTVLGKGLGGAVTAPVTGVLAFIKTAVAAAAAGKVKVLLVALIAVTLAATAGAAAKVSGVDLDLPPIGPHLARFWRSLRTNLAPPRVGPGPVPGVERTAPPSVVVAPASEETAEVAEVELTETPAPHAPAIVRTIPRGPDPTTAVRRFEPWAGHDRSPEDLRSEAARQFNAALADARALDPLVDQSALRPPVTTAPPPLSPQGAPRAAAASAPEFSAAVSGNVTLSPSGWLAASLAALPPAPAGADDGWFPGAIAVNGPSLNVAPLPGSDGAVLFNGGRFVAAVQDVGRYGTGRVDQAGGVSVAHQVRLGAGPGGSGTYAVTDGGRLVVPPAPAGSGADSGVVVGSSGKGILHLGNADGSGTLIQWSGQPLAASHAPTFFNSYSDSATPPLTNRFRAFDSTLIVRGDPAGSGTILGWGGAVGYGGLFINNGQVIADGYGRDRALIFAGYAAVTNTIDNPAANGRNGWYARNGGRLILPRIDVSAGTGTYTWGESTTDQFIDLVNSVRFTLHDSRARDSVDVSLLDPARADVPDLPDGHTFIGVWSIDTNLTRPSAIDLTVRYDDATAMRLGLDESQLKLWAYDGAEWRRIDDPTFWHDTDRYLIGGSVTGPLSVFAVSAPEPGTLPMLILVAAWSARRRRRRL